MLRDICIRFSVMNRKLEWPNKMKFSYEICIRINHIQAPNRHLIVECRISRLLWALWTCLLWNQSKVNSSWIIDFIANVSRIMNIRQFINSGSHQYLQSIPNLVCIRKSFDGRNMLWISFSHMKWIIWIELVRMPWTLTYWNFQKKVFAPYFIEYMKLN